MMSWGRTRVFLRRLLILLNSQKIKTRRIAITNSKNWTFILLVLLLVLYTSHLAIHVRRHVPPLTRFSPLRRHERQCRFDATTNARELDRLHRLVQLFQSFLPGTPPGLGGGP